MGEAVDWVLRRQDARRVCGKGPAGAAHAAGVPASSGQSPSKPLPPPSDGGAQKRAPTLYGIIALKLLKGLLFLALAIVAYCLSDNDLPAAYGRLLHFLRVNPERAFWANLALKIDTLTEAKVLLAAAGTFIYSLFSLVEGVGLIFRVRWAGWLAIGESAFFIPIEVYDLAHHFSRSVLVVLGLNILIVWYLFQNRRRLFHHHH
jgi:uncharacterized membrane protein (DUF2068 family)